MVLWVAVVGAQRNRVLKVISLLKEQRQHEEGDNDDGQDVNYLACVAVFGSYENEKQETVSYLERFVRLDEQGQPQSLATFFDDEEIQLSSSSCLPMIVAVGCGINEQDPSSLEQIRQLLDTLSGGSMMPDAVRIVAPTPPYRTMEEETVAYRALSKDDKERVTQQRSMGPGKMVGFIDGLVKEYREKTTKNLVVNKDDVSPTITVEAEEEGGVHLANNEKENEDGDTDQKLIEDQQEEEPLVREEIDPNKPRFACRICREILFGQDDLEDPPHAKQKHSFGYNKRTNVKNGQISCQSYFLQSPLHWMDTNGNEGKIVCPRCHCKLGQWNWSGAQCSCGTWVVPALQINCSKVDRIVTDQYGEQPDNEQQHLEQRIVQPMVFSSSASPLHRMIPMMEPVMPKW